MRTVIRRAFGHEPLAFDLAALVVVVRFGVEARRFLDPALSPAGDVRGAHVVERGDAEPLRDGERVAGAADVGGLDLVAVPVLVAERRAQCQTCRSVRLPGVDATSVVEHVAFDRAAAVGDSLGSSGEP
jgi:hypothetical protein